MDVMPHDDRSHRDRYRGAPDPEQREFTTTSGEPVRARYTADDLTSAGFDADRDLSVPGEFPFTRGIHPTMYRGRLWTMRMFAGFGSAEETNRRFRFLLEHGETGLSIAFDLPTLYGRDTDDPLSAGEFGKCGVAVSSLADMELLLDGIPLDHVTTSMTINGPAAAIWAMYIATAEKRGIPRAALGGTLQNDILKEFTAQNEYIYPPAASMKLVTDTVEFATREMPRWNSVSVSGYHIREAGATATEELAFTLADGTAYVDAALERGLDIDEFAPRISFFFNCHNDFFEEIAKFRAARRIWAHLMRDRYGAKNPRSWWMRFHTQTAGCSLTAQEPENNIVRTTIQALAGVLGGTQSLHTNSLDEALALPSDWAVRIALRTQQIIAYESGVTNSADPLGGSYLVESMTTEMEQRVRRILDEIDEIGGVLPAIDAGYFQRRIADSSYRYEQAVAARDKIVVGVNALRSDGMAGIPILQMDPEGEERQRERIAQVRRERDQTVWRSSLAALKEAARRDQNLMPYLLRAVKAYATLGEITECLKAVYGEHRPLAIV
ncbi:MAG TPA: methylmalonyl-CoA mutase family protein [Thermomicrobiaceae bacterium]|nr:methylmalonyl-CoA mutase family protein [Thermomicrobiaceae bacterium]